MSYTFWCCLANAVVGARRAAWRPAAAAIAIAPAATRVLPLPTSPKEKKTQRDKLRTTAGAIKGIFMLAAIGRGHAKDTHKEFDTNRQKRKR